MAFAWAFIKLNLRHDDMTNYYRGSKAPVKAQKADAENRSGTYRGVKHDGQGDERRKMNHGRYRGVKWQ